MRQSPAVSRNGKAEVSGVSFHSCLVPLSGMQYDEWVGLRDRNSATCTLSQNGYGDEGELIRRDTLGSPLACRQCVNILWQEPGGNIPGPGAGNSKGDPHMRLCGEVAQKLRLPGTAATEERKHCLGGFGSGLLLLSRENLNPSPTPQSSIALFHWLPDCLAAAGLHPSWHKSCMGGSLCASRPKKALTLCCVLV